jgi:hypothetical protein
LALRQRDYFLPGPQALANFIRRAAFRERAAEFKGYDVAVTGSVRRAPTGRSSMTTLTTLSRPPQAVETATGSASDAGVSVEASASMRDAMTAPS